MERHIFENIYNKNKGKNSYSLIDLVSSILEKDYSISYSWSDLKRIERDYNKNKLYSTISDCGEGCLIYPDIDSEIDELIDTIQNLVSDIHNKNEIISKYQEILSITDSYIFDNYDSFIEDIEYNIQDSLIQDVKIKEQLELYKLLSETLK